jgi:HD-GYP domain-containing protein (c-di-GMP phosphodiesterase class II)
MRRPDGPAPSEPTAGGRVSARKMDERVRSEEIEELQDLEPLEELGDLESGVNVKLPDSPVLAECAAKGLIRTYDRHPSPYAILDDSLSFVYRNPPFARLLKAFAYPEHSSFLGTIAKTLDADMARDIHEALKSPERGHAWKGTISHRAKDATAVITKVHISPFFGEDGSSRPKVFTVYLDDVTEENKGFLRDNLESLLRASLKKDLDTGNHVRRVNLYAKRLAEELFHDPRWPQVDKDFIDNISFLAAMHDVGKIGTPDDILNKEGPLNEFEWGIMKEHTINGAYILSSYPHPMAKEIALSHHEWWNGAGYPYNFAAKMIPLAARIVTVADVYDALRMKRSYKPAHTHELAIQKIKQEREIHFDPELVDVLVRIAADFERTYAANED